MKKSILAKLKVTIKRLWGKLVYTGVYVSKSFQKRAAAPRRKKRGILNIIYTVADRWRLFTLALIGLFLIYYGLGAAISSSLNNSLHREIRLSSPTERHINASLSYVLKSQIDDVAWTPALPLIFPAAILDNLPNFQLGVKDSTAALVKALARYHRNQELAEASYLLEYAPDIWLFSQTKEDKLAPGSARQYRKALVALNKADMPNKDYAKSTDELLFLLNQLTFLLNKRINKLHNHVQEYNADLLDIKADDLFYYTKGMTYTIYYALSALGKDYQKIIVETEQYENLTTALQFLNEAENLEPLVIKNANLQEAYAANHLMYLAYYLTRAENSIQTIRYEIEKRLKDNINDN